jgi:hypothetical protein
MNLPLQAFQYGQCNAYIDVLVYFSVLKLPQDGTPTPEHVAFKVVTNFILLTACVG